MTSQSTIDFYNTTSAAFFEQTVKLDMSALYARFLPHVPQGGRILDAGCGSGRDAKAFLDAGYDASAFDASPNMSALASNLLGREVACMTFDDIEYFEEFDGIWACASLLHVPRPKLQVAIQKLVEALKSGGVMYITLKDGEGECQDPSGRDFTYVNFSSLVSLIQRTGQLDVLDIWTTEDVRPDKRATRWWNAVVRKDHVAAQKAGLVNPDLYGFDHFRISHTGVDAEVSSGVSIWRAARTASFISRQLGGLPVRFQFNGFELVVDENTLPGDVGEKFQAMLNRSGENRS